ncbi:MAG: prolyl oligopeptidase family serine peptidase [Gammaproteobacteria bacterium]|nr:prolyl oligopeptidase family serine peptidase [Gammaproteobacteria bacterium]
MTSKAQEAGRLQAARMADGDPYTLSLPADFIPERVYPLVLSLHFGGPVSPFYGRALLEGVVEPALRQLDAIMIAPDCPESRWADPACEHRVLRLLDEIAERYQIDAARIVITGYSKGGIGTWDLALRHPDRFSAAIVMAGRPAAGAIGGAWQVPLYVIHAEEDELMPLTDTRQVVQTLRDRGVPVEFEVLQGVGHYQTDRFIEPLRRAVPWLQRMWGESDAPSTQ